MNSSIHKDAHFFWKNKIYDVYAWIDLVRCHPECFETSWEKEIRHFVLDWVGDLEYIEVHTSGSTGPPKQMRLSKAVMRHSALSTNAYFGLGVGAETLLCLPVDFIAGKMMIVRAFVNGWTLYFQAPAGKPGLDRVYDFVPMTPMQAANLLAGESGLTNAKNLLLGGGAIPLPLEINLKAQRDNRIFHSYGMTETATHVAIRQVNGDRAHMVFEALQGISFSSGPEGELIIHAPSLDQSALLTHDVVRLLDQSHFIWQGRKDNVINSGGIKLLPEQIEKKIMTNISLPFFVAGLPDATLGECIVLVIEGENGDTDESQLLVRMRSVLSKYEMVKSIQYLPRFPRTSSGKIIRGQALGMLKNLTND